MSRLIGSSFMQGGPPVIMGHAFTADTGSVSSKSVSLTIPAGNLALGWICDEGNRTLNLPSGYADVHLGQVDHDDNASFDFRAVWDDLASQITSQTFTIDTATTAWDCGILNIAGAHGTSPINDYAVTVSQTTDAAVCPAVTTTVDNCLVLRMLIIDNDPGSGVSYPSGLDGVFLQHTLNTGGIQMYLSLATEVKQAAGPVAASGVWKTTGWSTPRRSIALTVAVAPP